MRNKSELLRKRNRVYRKLCQIFDKANLDEDTIRCADIFSDLQADFEGLDGYSSDGEYARQTYDLFRLGWEAISYECEDVILLVLDDYDASTYQNENFNNFNLGMFAAYNHASTEVIQKATQNKDAMAQVDETGCSLADLIKEEYETEVFDYDEEFWG